MHEDELLFPAEWKRPKTGELRTFLSYLRRDLVARILFLQNITKRKISIDARTIFYLRANHCNSNDNRSK